VPTIHIKARESSGFSRKMDMFMALLDHHGVVAGGSWDRVKLTAGFGISAHGVNCCKRVPPLARIGPAVKARILSWCTARGLDVTWCK
jgi:hypothetical protein